MRGPTLFELGRTLRQSTTRCQWPTIPSPSRPSPEFPRHADSEVAHETGRSVPSLEHAHARLDRLPGLEDLLHADAADESHRVAAGGDVAARGYAPRRTDARRR